jgi:acetamidase/formamidase
MRLEREDEPPRVTPRALVACPVTRHRLPAETRTLHGPFDNSHEPVLTIDSGDTVVFTTLDAGWGRDAAMGGRPAVQIDLPAERKQGHALTGPIYIRGAQPGAALEIEIGAIRPADWGTTWAGPREQNPLFSLGVDRSTALFWEIDADAGRAVCEALGLAVQLRPFMGVMGNALAAPGPQSTTPPRRVGGNMDCKELVTGSTLWLPIEVEGALFSVGDGHGVQGDGEVGQTAIECSMEEVELTFRVRDDLSIDAPRAETPRGYLTMGFDEDLDRAAATALDAMLDHLEHTLHIERPEAMALASLVVDLHVTQVVNQACGVHALFRPESLQRV